MKISFKKDIRAKFLDFDKLHYVQIAFSDEQNLEEFFLKQACLELGLKDIFSYELAFLKDKNTAHVFLCEYDDLDKEYDFITSEILCFSYLKALNTDESGNFCVLYFEKSYSFMAIFEDNILKICKNIPKYTQNLLKDKNKFDDKTFLADLQSLELKELMQKYKSEEIFVFFDEEYKDLLALLQDNFALKSSYINKQTMSNLLFLASKEQNKDINFNKNFIFTQSKFFNQLLLVFSLAFVLSIAYPLYDFVDFKLKEDTYKHNISKNKLHQENTQKLKEEQAFMLEQKEELTKELSKHLNPSFMLEILEKLSLALAQNKTKINSLNIENKNLIISADKSPAFERFSVQIYSNAYFILKDKKQDEGSLELFLEFKDER
ncbi:hypothetical protein DMB92_01675 [Campylobacter sp. MIT 99-7217]|uniref:hypothetical protein n=1 Tax=Campylobacter sp. MIT 99-7217 TaxID=535091 RepID=UPI0011575D7D|nr:hypothetical protein [Campylobacter sp. MIT 99-7217]TQR34695.1 hypothetical protein DMB92_01675 [Campylobacter sp. MIT 99-7217]